MKRLVEQRTFYNMKVSCLGWSYQSFAETLGSLLCTMRDKIGHSFTRDNIQNLTFFMNIPLYNEFSISCKTSGHDPDMFIPERGFYNHGVRIVLDPTMYIGDTQSPDGYVRLIYEEPEPVYFHGINETKAVYDFWTTQFKTKPHIDHVKFNGPATIVFWKDGTKTVVKHDGIGRGDKRLGILYAFIRKIYGEGRPYHNILNEIEEAKNG